MKTRFQMRGVEAQGVSIDDIEYEGECTVDELKAIIDYAIVVFNTIIEQSLKKE